MYRNQDMSYTAQLNFGIRWFDIDLCWVTEDEATTAIPAGLWTCHGSGYAGLVEEIIVQVNDWLNVPENRYEIVSLFFNGDYDRSRSEPISVALNDLLASYWTASSTGDILHPVMNDEFKTTGMWPRIIDASGRNERVFVFLHESLQLGNQPWAHDPIPSQNPSIVVKNNCNDLIDFSSGVCDVCTDLWGIDAIGNRGLCLFQMAELCNSITYNATRACLDLRMEYGKTLNVIEVDFPDKFPEGGLSVVDIANNFNKLNVIAYYDTPTPSPVLTPDMNNCTPAYTPSPSPSPKPRPSNYCDALKQISETPLYYFQCTPNDACTLLECPVDLFANGKPFKIEISAEGNCDGVGTFVIEIFSPPGTFLGRVALNESKTYNMLTFPLVITIDQIGGAIEVEVGHDHSNSHYNCTLYNSKGISL